MNTSVPEKDKNKPEIHLPGTPSEKEVLENGVNVGEMDALLLQKIEELTRYVIDLKKENDALRKELDEIRNELEAIKRSIGK